MTDEPGVTVTRSVMDMVKSVGSNVGETVGSGEGFELGIGVGAPALYVGTDVGRIEGSAVGTVEG